MQHITLHPNPNPDILPFAHAVKAGDFLFVSGQLGADVLSPTGDEPPRSDECRDAIAVQMRQVMENLKTVLQEGGSGFDRVVMARIFLRDFRDYDVVNEIYASYFQSDKLPCRTTVGVIGLANQCDVEIDLIAYCDHG